MAKRLGVTHPLNPYFSLSIGSSDGVSPLDMATVFATFAADGVRHDPIFIKKVEDSDGNVIFEDNGRRCARHRPADRPHRHRRAPRRHHERARASAPSSTGRSRRARRAPPTRSATPGSSATRRSSWPRCGWATPPRYTPMRNVGELARCSAARTRRSSGRSSCRPRWSEQPARSSRRRTRSSGRQGSTSARTVARRRTLLRLATRDHDATTPAPFFGADARRRAPPSTPPSATADTTPTTRSADADAVSRGGDR